MNALHVSVTKCGPGRRKFQKCSRGHVSPLLLTGPLSLLVLAVEVDGAADGDRVLLEAVLVQAGRAAAVHEAEVTYGGEVVLVASWDILNN